MRRSASHEKKKPCSRSKALRTFSNQDRRATVPSTRHTATHRLLVALIPSVAISGPRLLPMRRTNSRSVAHPIGNALDDSARHRAPTVVLKNMDHLVGHDAPYLEPDVVGCSLCALYDASEVRQREVELFVQGVEVRRAGVRDAFEGVQVQNDASNGRYSRLGRFGGLVVVQRVQHGGNCIAKQAVGPRAVLEECLRACKQCRSRAQRPLHRKLAAT